MNIRGIHAIYRYEMNRSFRTLIQSLVSPVLSTILYFIVFGAAIGSRMDNISNVSYGAFIVPGLIMLTVQMQSVNNASFGIYFPKFIGTTYELLSAPISTKDNGADSNSYVVPINFGKYIPKDALLTLCICTVSIINPGTINAPYETSLILSILDPMAAPKTIKYKIVDRTGDTKLCIKVLKDLFISYL